ncbi:MAG: hypothetical protein WBP90_07970 [Terracidiphilus sp.]
MSINSILGEIDAEIEGLQQARALLSSLDGAVKKASTPTKKVAKRRKLSAKSRRAIADAQKARWARVRANKK